MTDLACYWRKAPVKSNIYKKLDEISFGVAPKHTKIVAVKQKLLTENAINNVLLELKDIFPAVSTIVPNFMKEKPNHDRFVEEICLKNFFKIEHLEENPKQLEYIGRSLNFEITRFQKSKAEKITRMQINSVGDVWRKLRRYRITASIFKRVCRTNISNPSKSLLEEICNHREFSSAATSYGRAQEKNAINFLLKYLKRTHIAGRISPAGLFIDGTKSFYAGSPDGIFKCACCSHNVPVEVKCPFTLRNGEDIRRNIEKKNSCLNVSNKSFSLSKNHSYYFQVQMQMYLTNAPYAYLCIYSPKKKIILKVKYYEKFMRKELKNSDNYFYQILAPFLLKNT